MSVRLHKNRIWISGIVSLMVVCAIVFVLWYSHQSPIKEQHKVEKAKLDQLLKAFDTIYWKNPQGNLILANQAISISKKIGDSNSLAKFLYFKSSCFFDLGRDDSILIVSNNTINIAQKINNEIIVAKTKNVIANYYIVKNSYYQALKYFYDALKIFEKYNDTKNIAIVYNGLGLIYFNLKDNEKAISYFIKAVNYFKKQGELHKVAIVSQNIGNCYSEEKNYNKAIVYHQNALEAFRKINDSTQIISVFINLSIIYRNLGKYQDAFNYLNHAKDYSERMKNQRLLSITLQDIGSLYLETGNFTLSKKFLKQSLSIFSKVGNKKGKMDALFALSEIADREGNVTLSYKYYKDYVNLKDSVLDGETQKKIAELQGKYDFKKKEYEAELIHKKYEIKKRQNVILIISFISSVIIILLFAGLIWLLNKNLKKSAKLSRLEKIQHQAEIEARNKELITSSLQLITKNEILTEISLLTEKVNKSDNTDSIRLNAEVKKILQQNLNLDKDWEHFKEMFEKVYLNFFATIKNICPELSENELRVCAYLKINLQNKEIARILNINHESVIKCRYRIRKKLKLDNTANLEEYIRSIS